MIINTPAPASLRACTTADLSATSMTARSLIELAHNDMPTSAERTTWINPTELDDVHVRTLVDPASAEAVRRTAAGALLAAKAFIVFRPELVNVPLALGFKELKRGAVGLRAIGYDRGGQAICILVFNVQNDKQVSEWAMDHSDQAVVDPAISKALQEDLKHQLLTKVAALRRGEGL